MNRIDPKLTSEQYEIVDTISKLSTSHAQQVMELARDFPKSLREAVATMHIPLPVMLPLLYTYAQRNGKDPITTKQVLIDTYLQEVRNDTFAVLEALERSGMLMEGKEKLLAIFDPGIAKAFIEEHKRQLLKAMDEEPTDIE